MSNVKEEVIETYLDDRVKFLGGFTVKLNPKGYVGIPDRLVVLPGVIFVAELKRPKGGRLALLQAWWRLRFTNLGHRAVVCRTKAEVDAAITAAIIGANHAKSI